MALKALCFRCLFLYLLTGYSNKKAVIIIPDNFGFIMPPIHGTFSHQFDACNDV
jgi:hypothetical protein